MLVVIGDPAPYNSGFAALDADDIANAPPSGQWKFSSCANSPCHK
jgi:hypothetical protein